MMTRPSDQAMPSFDSEGMTASDGKYEFDCSGLTKREWFAGMAMQGLCARFGFASEQDHSKKNRANFYHQVAELSVLVADSLIAELNKEQRDGDGS